MFFHHTPPYKKTALLLAAAFVAGLVGGGVASVFARPYIEGSASFIIQNERHPSATDYDYEGYYTLKTADEAARMLVSWLRSPGGVESVYREAGIVPDIQKLRSYERVFDVRHTDTQFFEVRFRAKTPRDAERLADAVTKKLAQELSGLSGSKSALVLSATLPVFIARPVPLGQNILYGGLLAFVLAAFGMLFRQTLTKP